MVSRSACLLDQWKQTFRFKQQQLKNHKEYDNLGGDASFANSIDVFGQTIVVGMPYNSGLKFRGFNSPYEKNKNNFDESGKVFIFRKKRNNWHKTAMLKAPNSFPWDYFGYDLMLQNKTLIVGAFGDSSNSVGINTLQNNCLAPSSGAVHVYNFQENKWKHSNYIKSSHPQDLEQFGMKLDFDGKSLIVASKDMYFFSKTNNKWEENILKITK